MDSFTIQPIIPYFSRGFEPYPDILLLGCHGFRYEENLGPLEKYDKEHNTNLLETLAVYLYASGDYNQAAMNMFVHVNTLRYRLKKVEEILGQDLRQLAVLVNLYTALQVKVMLGR
jgi:DNA-binding PucR family transcriptional regulator